MNKPKILSDAYKQLDLTFEMETKNHLHIKNIDKCFFLWDLFVKDKTDLPNWNLSLVDDQLIIKGSHKFYYANIYEILLWYYYYTVHYKHIQRGYRITDGRFKGYYNCSNRAYFSRIPTHYTTLDSKKGLNIVKEALDNIILKHKGVPKYYDSQLINEILVVKEHD